MSTKRTVEVEGSWCIPLSDVRRIVAESSDAPGDARVRVTGYDDRHPTDKINSALAVTWEVRDD